MAPFATVARVEAVLVTHSHWDREWYRTFQDFRARLVDLVDRVIELCDADPGYRFLLDGQTVVLEDYLEIRPQPGFVFASAEAVRLDETPDDAPLSREGESLRFRLAPHALRTLRLALA